MSFSFVSLGCENLIGKTLYFNKETPIVVDRINIAHSGVKVISINGKTYNLKHL